MLSCALIAFSRRIEGSASFVMEQPPARFFKGIHVYGIHIKHSDRLRTSMCRGKGLRGNNVNHGRTKWVEEKKQERLSGVGKRRDILIEESEG